MSLKFVALLRSIYMEASVPALATDICYHQIDG